jgi:protein SCO1/2
MNGARRFRRTALAGAPYALAMIFVFGWPSPAGAQTYYAQPPANGDDTPLQGATVKPALLRDVSLEQRLNESIPLDLAFRDDHGRPVHLRDFFSPGKPVILSLVYYQCPMLCTQVLNGMARGMKELPLALGKDYEVLTISIDPKDTPVFAEAKHELYAGFYMKPGAATGWHFLVGDEPQIKQLAAAVGFHYAYDPISKQFAHPSAIMVLTPDGRLARYFYGIKYPERDLRLGLVEASAGKIGTPVDAILLYCYHYDPSTGKYGLLISRVIQIAGILTVLAVGILIAVLLRREDYALPPGRKAIRKQGLHERHV